MGKIKNMGTGTMRFKEGLYVTGSAANENGTDSEYTLIASGSVLITDKLYVADTAGLYSDKIRRFSDSDNTTKILLNDELLKFYAGDSTEDIVRIGETNKGNDNNFFVSGSANSKGTVVAGTAIFGGDVVVSGSFYAKQRQAFTHKYSKTDNTDEALIRYNAAGSNNTTGNHTNNKFVAPADGKLISVILRSTDTMGSTVVRLLTNTDGNANLETGSALDSVTVNVSSANTAFLFVFSDAAEYNAGDILGIAINPTSAHGNVDLTSVWEFDWVG